MRCGPRGLVWACRCDDGSSGSGAVRRRLPRHPTLARCERHSSRRSHKRNSRRARPVVNDMARSSALDRARSRGDRPLHSSHGLQLDHRARRIHRRSACAVWSPLPRRHWRHLMERLSQTLAHEVLGHGRLLFPIQGSRGSHREALKNFCARSQEDLKTCFSTPRSCRPRADSHLILSFTGQGYPWPVYWLQTDRHRFDRGQSATARRSILRHFICKRPDCAPAACSSPKERRVYGASSLILVAQFPRDVRVPPQEPIAPVRYSANVHV